MKLANSNALIISVGLCILSSTMNLTSKLAASAIRPANMSRASSTSQAHKKIVVFGGGGYVGSRIVRQALCAGHTVVSINRSKKPSGQNDPGLTWREGDIFKEADWLADLEGCDAAISCVGAFGSNEFMQRINGDANIHAITQAHRAGVPRFVYLSTVENNLPDFFLRGYFEGKRRAEQALLRTYPEPGAGVVLRPSFMYGTRAVPQLGESVGLPLGLLGRPLELLLDNPVASKARHALPGMLALLAPPIAVDSVARTALRVAVGGEYAMAVCANPPHSRTKNVLSRDDIALIASLNT